MDSELFRKSSIDRLNSPEQLNEYIRVAKPGVWLILSAIVLLLAGVIVWGVFGLVETKVDCGALVENGRVICYVDAAQAEQLKPGDPVEIAGSRGTVKSVSAAPLLADGQDAYLLRLAGLAVGDICYTAEAEVPGLSDGVYPAVVIVESLRPISFVIH